MLEEIDQPAGRADQDVDRLVELSLLLLISLAAVANRELERQVCQQAVGVLVNLDREFARRRENQRARAAEFGFAPGMQQALGAGQQERQRLAGAGLRLAGNVVAGEQARQRLRLDRGAVLEVEPLERCLQARIER